MSDDNKVVPLVRPIILTPEEQALDQSLDELIWTLQELPRNARRTAIFAACDDADWDYFAEYVDWRRNTPSNEGRE